MVVRLLRSHHWVYDQLMASARPPTTFTWAGPEEPADITIYIVPPWPEPDRRTSVRMIKPKNLGRLYLYSQEDDGWFWAPGVFTAAREGSPPEIAGGFYLHPDECMPGRVGSMIEASRDRTPDLLWSFVGDLRTAPTVRRTLVGLDDPRAEARGSIVHMGMAPDERMRLHAQYARTLTRSWFVACPTGFSPTSHRLFESMRAGRVPVVIADAWRPPPLIDWGTCSIQIAEKDVHHLPQILREREPEAAEIGRRAREIWEERFSSKGIVHQLVESCLMLDAHRPPPSRRLGLALRSVPTTAARRAVGAVVKPRIAELRGQR
jgi:hypothetical protein